MAENELVLVKLGGSLITDKTKPETARLDTIQRLAKEVHQAKQEKGLRLVIGHGGGSFPHVPAKEFKMHEGFVHAEALKGFALTHDAAARLNRIMVKALIEAGENAVSVPPSAWCVAENGKVLESFTRPLEVMLEKGLLPVPYGDVVVDVGRGSSIFSTEKVFSVLVGKMEVGRIILAGNVDGVLDSQGKVILEISRENFESVKPHLGGSAGVDVTGGMLDKVESLLALAGKGIQSMIINGDVPGNLEKALKGERIGTIIKPIIK